MGNAQGAASAQSFWHASPSADLVGIGRPHRQPLGRDRQHHVPPRGASSRREKLLLGAFALVLHGAVIYWLGQRPEPVLPEAPVQIPPMTIEFTAPAPPVVEPPPPQPIPEPVIEPPPPPPPVVDEVAVKKPPKPEPKPRPKAQPPKAAPKPAAKPAEPAPTPKAATPPTPPAPPAPSAPTPVTPPSANAGYLRNPAPEYPAFAQRRGWEGTVLLRVHVLASGKPSKVRLQTSSGREALDEAAIRAVKRWSFVPAKRGDVAQDGWVSVPIDFRLH
ncbi:transport protein TonB [compost metagenome]